MVEIGLIGPGKVGCALVRLLPGDSYRLGPVLSRSFTSARRAVRNIGAGWPAEHTEAYASSDIVLIAVPDGDISRVAVRLSEASFPWRNKVVLHTSGICGRAVLAPLRKKGASVGSMHPLYIFQRPPLSLAGVHFTVEGGFRAVREARKIIRSLDAEFQLVKPEQKVRHSIAETIVSDFSTGLLEAAVSQMVDGGFSRRRALEAIECLLEASVKDFRRSGKSSRPGPLLRGDTDTIRRHLQNLRGNGSLLESGYRQAALGTLAILKRDRNGFSFLSDK